MRGLANPQSPASRTSTTAEWDVHPPECEFPIPSSALTLNGFCAWAVSDAFPERGQISFLDGELYIDMSPDELKTHHVAKAEVNFVLTGLVKRRGRLFSEKALLKNTESELSTEPDAAFACWKTLRLGHLRFVSAAPAADLSMQLEGRPDWVLQVLTDASDRREKKRHRVMYHRAGIPEYWLIDARGAKIDLQILVWGKKDYKPAAPGRSGWKTSPMFKRRFRFTRRRGPVRLWLYELEVKPLR